MQFSEIPLTALLSKRICDKDSIPCQRGCSQSFASSLATAPSSEARAKGHPAHTAERRPVNEAYRRIITAAEEDRRDLFVSTARRVGTTEQNVEKDFWVCWTLDALFHGRPENAPRLLFKGGTALAKAVGLRR